MSGRARVHPPVGTHTSAPTDISFAYFYETQTLTYAKVLLSLSFPHRNARVSASLRRTCPMDGRAGSGLFHEDLAGSGAWGIRLAACTSWRGLSTLTCSWYDPLDLEGSSRRDNPSGYRRFPTLHFRSRARLLRSFSRSWGLTAPRWI